jgi:hypothetical protein
MSVKYTSRTGKTYYLHEKTTATGKLAYFFSHRPDGPSPAAIPDGYEIFENVHGQVFLRKKTAPIILPDELALVEAALLQQGKPGVFKAEVKKNAIVIYEANDLGFLDVMAAEWRRRPLSDVEKSKHYCYMAVLRFTLEDKKFRAFATERFCFRGSVDDWIYIGGPGPLAGQIKQFVKHLGKESMCELF